MKMARLEESMVEQRRGLSEERRLLDEERHSRGLQTEQIVSRLDSLASALEAAHKRQSRDQAASIDHMHAVMDEREARVKAEIVESDALQSVRGA